MSSFADKHLHKPIASFDGGDLDCGNGLLLLILGVLPQQLIGLCAIALTQSNFP